MPTLILHKDGAYQLYTTVSDGPCYEHSWSMTMKVSLKDAAWIVTWSALGGYFAIAALGGSALSAVMAFISGFMVARKI